MSKEGQEEVSDISPVLFLDTSGQSMCFYVRPGPTKTQLYPLITNGGGSLCRSQEPGAILLIDPRDATTITASSGLQYFSTKYITDCVEQNLQLDLDDYVISVGPSVQTRMASGYQGSGRLGYSPEDDAAIVKFMEKRQHEAKGNLVWKEMEKRRVTEHSWQSMRDRFLKHLQNRLVKKSPTKRKPLCFTQSPLRKKKVTENSDPETDASQNSPQKSVGDESDTQVASENSVCPAVRTDPQPSPERARAPPDVADAAGEPPQDERDVPVQEQETPEPVMTRRSGLDEDRDGRDVTDGPSEQSSPNKTRQTTEASTPDSRQILAKAAREFEDSDVMDESEEVEEVPIMKPSDTCERSSSPAASAGEPETQAELLTAARRDTAPEEERPGPSSTAGPEEERPGPSSTAAPEEERPGPSSTAAPEEERPGTSSTAGPEEERPGPSSTAGPEEERPGPSSTAVPVSSSHVFLLDSESQDKQHSQTPEEAPSSDSVEHVENLMTKTKKDLLEVTKALWKASGDLARAQVYLLDGYECELHGPVWTLLDDDILLSADPDELEQLQSKYGEEEVTRRRDFLTAGTN